MSNLEKNVDRQDSESPDKIGIPSNLKSMLSVDIENLIQEKLSQKQQVFRCLSDKVSIDILMFPIR